MLLGGDFNLRSLSLERFGFHTAAAHEVDYVFTRGFTTARDAAVLDPGPLSDHAPVAVTVEP
jgi:endonuclease/exonuclease/phosphatase (EEP) superfamily protein YafD